MRRLLIRPGGIGDCITCFPVMEWLRADYTEVWTPSAIVPLVQFADRVRSIAGTGLDLFGIEGRDTEPAFAGVFTEFNEVVSWYGTNRPAFRDAVRSLGPRWRFLPALPPTAGKIQVTDFYASCAGAPAGLTPRIYADPGSPRGTVVIHPFSGGRSKNWPLSRFRELAERLDQAVEWTAGPEEELPGARHFDNLLDLARWMSGAALYVGNDCGITHLAAASGIPVIALYGASDSSVWGCRGKQVHLIVRDSMESIHVSDVAAAVECALLGTERRNVHASDHRP